MFDRIANISDEDIENALEKCMTKECVKCKYEKWKETGQCERYLLCDAASLVKRINKENVILKTRYGKAHI